MSDINLPASQALLLSALERAWTLTVSRRSSSLAILMTASSRFPNFVLSSSEMLGKSR